MVFERANRRNAAAGRTWQNLGLAEARRKAEHTRSAIAKGENPADLRRALFVRRNAATEGVGTFGSIIAAYYEQGPEKACGRVAQLARWFSASLRIIYCGLLSTCA
jgi:hypothetical protein